jgi:hypothetical protein
MQLSQDFSYFLAFSLAYNTALSETFILNLNQIDLRHVQCMCIGARNTFHTHTTLRIYFKPWGFQVAAGRREISNELQLLLFLFDVG